MRTSSYVRLYLPSEITYYYIIVCTDESGNQSRSDEYALWVSNVPSRLARIEITPASPELAPGDAVTFKAQGYDAHGDTMNVRPFWHVTGNIGTIDSSGTFVAGDTPGSGDVVAFFGQGVFGDASTDVISGSAKVVVRAVPKVYALSPNYPNPFNPSTTIRYALPHASMVWLAIYNLSGQRVCVLDQDLREAGWYERKWDGRDGDGREVSSGIYIVQLMASTHPKRSDFSTARRMVLVR